MKEFYVSFGTNSEIKRSKTKEYITAIHSSYVFEEMFSGYLLKHLSQYNVRFKEDKYIGIHLVSSNVTKTYFEYTNSETCEKVIVHEFNNECITYEDYILIKDPVLKFEKFSYLIKEHFLPLLKSYIVLDGSTILEDIIDKCLRSIENNDYQLEILINKSPKYNKNVI